MKSIILFALCAVCLADRIEAQVYLQLEKAGTLRTIRYNVGDLLTFQLRNDDKGWNERTIVFIDVPRNRLVFPDVTIHLDSIAAIRLDRKAVAAQILGIALQGGGINLILFTGYDAIFRERDLDWTAVASGVINIAAGTLIKRIFRHSVFRINPRKHLRLLDLNFSETDRL